MIQAEYVLDQKAQDLVAGVDDKAQHRGLLILQALVQPPGCRPSVQRISTPQGNI